MCFARLGRATHAELHNTSPPFSNFHFVDSLLPGQDESAVRRLFSLARRVGTGQSLVLEDIEAAGAVADENAELTSLFPGYQCSGLKRLTFWRKPCGSLSDTAQFEDTDLLGYAILKQDTIPGRPTRWHIFESVFRKYAHEHNCVPGEASFTVSCGSREYQIPGVLYCQQNRLNKSCAQVALRSLLSRIFPEQDISYSNINRAAGTVGTRAEPGEGLDTTQIRAVLDSYGIRYDDFDYIAAARLGNARVLPYSRVLYSGIENGLGGLLGFELSRSSASGEKHIIPFYGHTFNQDTWVPRASVAYFHVGDQTCYISSQEWTSSFIGHDDNFGSNFCVPRRFLEANQVKYVVALRPRNTEYGAILAEAIAVDCLYAARNTLPQLQNYWVKRLVHHIDQQDVVLRTLYVHRDQYVAHLRECRDWGGDPERADILSLFSSHLPENLWMAEVSIPELFPANYRKLGEIMLDACVPVYPNTPSESLLVVARFPGSYLINVGSATFAPLDSDLRSHVPLCCELDLQERP